MKVALITRSTLFTVAGGDTIQVTQTARYLSQLGISTEVKLTDEEIDYTRYDLLHFFNIIRPADILCHVQKSGKPFVLSTLLVDYGEYDKHYRKGITGMLLRLLSTDMIEYVKTIARFLTGKDKLMTPAYFWKGQKKCISEILEKASLVFPGSLLEHQRLGKRYIHGCDSVIVPNGIDPGLFIFHENTEKDPALVLCVARIEGIKNQENLIRALNNTKFKLLIIGAPAPGHLDYYRRCREIAGPNISFMEYLPQEKLVAYYQKAAVHVLPSWFETCGLSSLEAAAMGCNIVVTGKGYTREYYEDHAFYCEPGSPDSILKAVENAAKAPFPALMRDKVLSCYTWLQAAVNIANAYQHIPVYS